MANLLTAILNILIFSHITFIPPVTASPNEERVSDEDLETLHQKAPKLDKKVLMLAAHAYNHALEKDKVKKPYLTVIDYRLASSEERMWVFDVDNDKLLFHTYVAHGKNTGARFAKNFSNRNQSKESSLGTYVTKDTYYGGKGLSLNLQGLEHGFNDNAYDRRVVVHGAWYVDEKFIKQSGQAGRSWGCPAVGKAMAKPIINAIKGGSVLFAYYPSHDYLAHSDYIA
jgi:hypothetical protein